MVWATLVLGRFEQVWVELTRHIADDLRASSEPPATHVTRRHIRVLQRGTAAPRRAREAEELGRVHGRKQPQCPGRIRDPVRYGPAIRACRKHSAWQSAVWLLWTEESLGQDENIYTSTKAQFDIRHRRKAAEVACGAGFLH